MNVHRKESLIWPKSNFAVRQLEPSLKSMYKRWKAYKLLSPYPRSEWPQLQCKVYAASLLWGKRSSWGAERMWRGDYLSSPTENIANALYTHSLNSLMTSDRFNQVLNRYFFVFYDHISVMYKNICRCYFRVLFIKPIVSTSVQTVQY